MKYNWLLIASFFALPLQLCHAETQASEIKDAEFIIQKETKNRVNQAERLFFKAPAQTTKHLNKPLKTVKALVLEDIFFEPLSACHLPFSLKSKASGHFFKHYYRVGIGSLLLPYLEFGLVNFPFAKAIWSTNVAFIPELYNKKSREALFGLECKYGIGSWLLQPSLNYQYDWHKYSDTTDHTCRLHQGAISLLVKQANQSSSQDGAVKLNLINYQNKKIQEQLFVVKHKWVKQLHNCYLKVASYNDISRYTNDSAQQTRFIFSLSPSLYFRLFKSMQLKAGLRMAYHNDPIPGKIGNFALYPMVKVGSVVATWLIPYIGVKGMGNSVAPLHLHDVVRKNPFIAPIIAPNSKLSHYHESFKLYGGSKGMLLANLSYHLRIAYRQLKNQSRIIPISGDQIRLNYSPEDHNLLKTTGLLDYAIPNTTLHTTIKISYHKYFENRLTPVWWYNKPLYRLKQSLAYKPHSKILLKGNLHLHSTTTIDIEGVTTLFKKRVNVSLGIDYFISKNFTAFLMVANLLNRKHSTYTGYPDKKINITGGLEYKW